MKKLINSSSLLCSSRRLPSCLVLHTKMSTGRPRSLSPKLSENVSSSSCLSANFIWGRIFDTVKTTVDNCHQCHLVKTPKHLQPPPQQLPAPACRFNSVHIDLIGPLPESQGFKYLLTCCDCFTRWLEAIPFSSIDSTTFTSGSAGLASQLTLSLTVAYSSPAVPSPLHLHTQTTISPLCRCYTGLPALSLDSSLTSPSLTV